MTERKILSDASVDPNEANEILSTIRKAEDIHGKQRLTALSAEIIPKMQELREAHERLKEALASKSDNLNNLRWDLHRKIKDLEIINLQREAIYSSICSTFESP